MKHLTIATYNVLADAYVRPEYYPLARPEDLVTATRYPRVVERVTGLDADVICLQEVDGTLFTLLELAFGQQHYRSIHAPKTRRPEGLAIFVREPWETVRCGWFPFMNDAVPGHGRSGFTAAWAYVKQGRTDCRIMTSHLTWDPPDARVRVGLLQTQELITKAGDGDRTIICGDFNAAPDDRVVRMFEEAGYRDAFDPSQPTFNAAHGTHKIDYIMCSRDLVVEPQPLTSVDHTTPLPSETEPSDHIPLVAKIASDD